MNEASVIKIIARINGKDETPFEWAIKNEIDWKTIEAILNSLKERWAKTMSDLKEFWSNTVSFNAGEEPDDANNDYDYQTGWNCALKDIKETLGMFFWERGGKQFVLTFDKDKLKFKLNGFVGIAKRIILMKDELVDTDSVLWAKDFLDCLACLGEDKVKELIEGLK